MSRIDLRGWHHLAGHGPFSAPNEPAFAGISGGRTSAMMAALLDPKVELVFANTGREHIETLLFLKQLSEKLERRITWVEWRPPPFLGDRPKNFRFEVVNWHTAATKGEPFREWMVYINAYRAAKGEPMITPWARQRICTAYLKHKVIDHYIESLGIESHTRVIGLRADEPSRVRGIMREGSRTKTFTCPLAAAGVEVSDVKSFWSGREWDLNLRDYEGNCTACFLKDESDIARMLIDPETDAAWWIAMQRDFPGFGGLNEPPYTQLLAEANYRLAVESAIREGKDPKTVPSVHPARRSLNIIRQEQKRVRDGSQGAGCSCEASLSIGDDDD